MSADGGGKAAAEREAGRASPGAHLRAELRRLGLDQVAVSKATGVSRQSVNNIINGRQPISRAMAGKLGRLTGHSSDYWLSESFGESPSTPYTADAAPRAAGLLVNHQIARAVKDGIIGIDPFNPARLRAASIELTLHANAQVPDKGLKLAAGAATQATTAETIELPRDYLGRIGAAEPLCRHGIVASAALQIEPGFKGRLQFHLFNAGGVPFVLRAGEPVIALEVFRLAATPDAEPRS